MLFLIDCLVSSPISLRRKNSKLKEIISEVDEGIFRKKKKKAGVRARNFY